MSRTTCLLPATDDMSHTFALDVAITPVSVVLVATLLAWEL